MDVLRTGECEMGWTDPATLSDQQIETELVSLPRT